MTDHARRELEPPAAPLKRGDSGPKVRQVQEWLTLHGYGTAIDGDFGPATERAVHSFQWDGQHDEATHWTPGVVTAETWTALTFPLWSASTWTRDGLNANRAIVHLAETYLSWGVREVGGPNAGPWVRYLCRGLEVPWCAGFATTVLSQALGYDDWYTLSCDELAAMARRRGQFMRADLRRAVPAMRVKPGDLFLIRAADGFEDWTHCGIVTAVGQDYFETAEGNTNQGGSREGTEACKRIRAFNNRTDFVLIGGGA